jgi:type II secretory pathway pseudopilin PulG
MGGLQFQHGNQDASTEELGSEARPEVTESETLKAGVVSELRQVERLRRLARPLAFTIFALLGLLAALLLYTWMRVEELTTLVQHRQERAAAAQSALQEAIDKQRAGPKQPLQQTASPPEVPPQVSSPAKESREVAPATAVHVQRDQAKASKQHDPDPRPAPSSGTGQMATEQVRPVAASPGPSEAAPAKGQEPAEVHQNPPATPRDPPPGDQGGSPPPPEQALPAQQGPEAIEKEQGEGGGSSDARASQLDSAVARNPDEIERLRKLGKRDYIEFALVRSGNRQQVTPDISLELRKVDLRRSRCSLDIYAEDYEFPTELGINEPAMVRVRAMWESVELVINKMGKNTVVGYLSAPKGVLAGGK